MRKNRFKLLFILSAICLSCYFLSTGITKKEGMDTCTFNKLVLSNIEALAGSEGGGGSTICIGNGSIDCSGEKVKYVYSGFSLDDF